MKKINKWALITLLSFLVSACSLHPDHVQMVNQQPDIYPDYIGVTIPVDIAPLNFSMTDDDFTDVYVDVKGEKGGSIHAEGTYADFDVDEWHQLLKANKGSRLLVSVMACREGNWYQYRDFSIEVSPNPLDEWGITYRRIAPSYALYGHMGLYQRCLSDFTETSMLENSQVHGQCMNCHTQNRTNPEQYVFHVRGEHGATVVHQHGKDVLIKARNDSLGGTMVYPYWHPSGRYCAFSTNKTAQMFHTGNNKRIEVFDTSSDVFVYDMEKHEVIKDTLIMTTG